MKFAVSVAMVVLLLALPLACVLGACQPSAPCCPKPNNNLRCPYDTLDSAKIAGAVAIADVPIAITIGIAPPSPRAFRDPLPATAPDRGDLYILNRILRI